MVKPFLGNYAIGSLALALVLATLASCYSPGRLGDIGNVQLGDVENRTAEGALAGIMAQAVSEQLSSRPGLAGKDMPGHSLDIDILEIGSSSKARARMRDRKARSDKSDAYQTVLYNLELTVGYRLFDEEGNCVLEGRVSGLASMPGMHDSDVAMKNALRQAAWDAARKILARVSDASAGDAPGRAVADE